MIKCDERTLSLALHLYEEQLVGTVDFFFMKMCEQQLKLREQ